MFQECTIVVKTNETTEIPIAKIVPEQHKVIYVFSRAGKKLKSKFNVFECDIGEN